MTSDEDISGRTSLVISDDDGTLRLCQESLSRAGSPAKTRRDALAGLDCILDSLSEDPIRLLVLDMAATGTFLPMLLKRIEGLIPPVCVIALYDGTNTEKVKTALELGVDELVRKPFGSDELRNAIRRACPE